MLLVQINSLKCGPAKCSQIVAEVTNKNGILVTYSAKGEVKRNLKACGFDVSSSSGSSGEKTDDQSSENLKLFFSGFFAFPKVLS